jgi:hypothetical protein
MMLDEGELLTNPTSFKYLDILGREKRIEVREGGLAYTFCHTLILLQEGDASKIAITFKDSRDETVPGSRLDNDISRHIFKWDGHVRKVVVTIMPG